MSNQEEQVREQLAAIEHERWADWQAWCHQEIRRVMKEGTHVENVLQRWDRQISTAYDALSDKEKASDMEQVDRYWPLIQKYVEQAETAARIAALQKYLLSVPTDSPGYDYIKSGIEREIHFAKGVSNE